MGAALAQHNFHAANIRVDLVKLHLQEPFSYGPTYQIRGWSIDELTFWMNLGSPEFRAASEIKSAILQECRYTAYGT